MLKPGMFISDRYEIIDKVGTGGMADVYKARCHRLNRFVAIKVLKSEYSDDKNFVAKFRAEAQSVAGLSHPNIVNVYDVGEDDGLYYIVMELIEGITLKNFIERKGKLEVKEAIGISIQIAQGMEAAHANHIIHRDIKPQNIIISRDGKVKVTDFGIAKAASSNTITSNAMGSVHYISPEQARGGYSDEKSDIYSLGIAMYEMLSGKVPFAGDNTVSVALLHIQGEAVPLHEIDPNIPLSVEMIVQKCMQKKPERRYLTASELIADLKKAIVQPNGTFVKMAPIAVDTSPTISLSDEEVSHIKSASKASNTAPINLMDSESEDQEETDEDTDVDPKLEKIMVAGGIVMAIILCAIVLILVSKFLFGGKKGATPAPTETPIVSLEPSPSASPDENASGVEVPRVIGMKLEEAQTQLRDLGFTNVRFTEESSNLFEKDYVINQTPEQDTKVELDSEIILIVSTGPESFAVPDVSNRSDAEAVTILEEAGLIVKHDYEYHDTIEQGKVTRTVPEKGSMVNKDDNIMVFLSRGKEIVDVFVPDLSNLSEAEANAALKEVGLKPGKPKYAHSDNVEEGLVISQDYTADVKVTSGTTVGFTVSLGPEEVEEPTYTFKSDVTIPASENPFTSADQTGVIKLVLTQDGQEKNIFEDTLGADAFPLNVPFEGFSESDGVVRMYLNGAVCPGQKVVTFKKVAS